MRGLAYRRHQAHRAKGRATRYLSWLWPSRPDWLEPRTVARYAIDRVPCSCALCGNPRRYFRDLTRQEIRAEAPHFPEGGHANSEFDGGHIDAR